MTLPRALTTLFLLASTACLVGCNAPSSRAPARSIDVGEIVDAHDNGEVTVLVFVAPWCPVSTPALAMARDVCAASNGTAKCVAVLEGGDASGLAGAPTLTTIADPGGRFAARLDLPTIPAVVVLDRHGVVRHVGAGYHGDGDRAALASEIDTISSEVRIARAY